MSNLDIGNSDTANCIATDPPRQAGIPDPEIRSKPYSRQLSTGMRHRRMPETAHSKAFFALPRNAYSGELPALMPRVDRIFATGSSPRPK